MTEQQISSARYHHGKPLPSIRGGMIAADAEELVADEPDVPSEDVQPGGDMAVRGVGREEGAAAMTADSTNTAGVLAFWVGLAVFACLFYLLCRRVVFPLLNYLDRRFMPAYTRPPKPPPDPNTPVFCGLRGRPRVAAACTPWKTCPGPQMASTVARRVRNDRHQPCS
jgi:hypothetical protein